MKNSLYRKNAKLLLSLFRSYKAAETRLLENLESKDLEKKSPLIKDAKQKANVFLDNYVIMTEVTLEKTENIKKQAMNLRTVQSTEITKMESFIQQSRGFAQACIGEFLKPLSSYISEHRPIEKKIIELLADSDPSHQKDFQTFYEQFGKALDYVDNMQGQIGLMLKTGDIMKTHLETLKAQQ